MRRLLSKFNGIVDSLPLTVIDQTLLVQVICRF